MREDEEELAEELEEEPPQKGHATVTESKVHSLAAGLSNISGSSERPAALITPPGTPDEAKTPHTSTSHPSDRHHNRVAEKDMQEEAEHDVKHHDSHDSQRTSAAKKGDSKPKAAGESPPATGIFETVLGLGLFVVVGVGAAWMAFMMQDPIKDGGAALTGV